ncbi:MAG: RDD family protein [Candidatus Nanohaloarchaea archaeon]|nr:RDD family protein [Candidatus Nanohaloarchaea archaeon]
MTSRIDPDKCQGILPRFGALFIDSILYGVIAYLLYTRTAWFSSWEVLAFLMLVYFVVFESMAGQTPGKMFFGLRVVDVSGSRCSPAAAMIRNIIRIIDQFPMLLYLVGAAFIWYSPRQQRLGDRAAGTVVIKE